MKNLKRIISLVIASILAVGLIGCSSNTGTIYDGMSKKELISQLTELSKELIAKENELANINGSVSGETDITSPGITSMGDGSGNMSFTTYDGKMVFPESFEFPGSMEMSSSPEVNLSDILTLTPNPNWVTKIGGTSIELEHSTGISGLIKLSSIPGNTYYTAEDIKNNVLGPWFESITSSSISYQEIFLDNISSGVQADLPIYIDEEPARLKCGMFYLGNNAAVYIFTYRAASKDANKEEMINNIINSMKMAQLGLSVK